MRALIAASALLGFLLVAAGAAGAHMIAPADAERWRGALLYGFVHMLAALVAACSPLGRFRLAAGWCFLLGVALFSLTQIAQMTTSADGASPFDRVSFIVPVGGLAFMAGWLILALAALKKG